MQFVCMILVALGATGTIARIVDSYFCMTRVCEWLRDVLCWGASVFYILVDNQWLLGGRDIG